MAEGAPGAIHDDEALLQMVGADQVGAICVQQTAWLIFKGVHWAPDFRGWGL